MGKPQRTLPQDSTKEKIGHEAQHNQYTKYPGTVLIEFKWEMAHTLNDNLAHMMRCHSYRSNGTCMDLAVG